MMGFMLKKIVATFIMPLPFFVVVGLLGLWFLYRNRIAKAKMFLTLSFAGILFFSYNPVANGLLDSLESQYQPPQEINNSIKYALLLGGDFDLRAYGGLKLYHQNPNLIIVTSGYEGKEELPEALINRDKLIQLGIPKAHIIAHTKPKDTQEEAQAMQKLVGKTPFYLVTSASHMPRAMRLFGKQGLHPIAIPSGFLQRKTVWLDFINASDAHKSQIAWHEYIGLLWSQLRGDI